MLLQLLRREASGSHSDAAGTDGGCAGDVLRRIADHDDLLSSKLQPSSSAHPAHGDRAYVVAMLRVIAESTIKKVFGEIKSAELQLCPAPDVPGQQAQHKRLVLRQIRQ